MVTLLIRGIHIKKLCLGLVVVCVLNLANIYNQMGNPEKKRPEIVNKPLTRIISYYEVYLHTE